MIRTDRTKNQQRDREKECQATKKKQFDNKMKDSEKPISEES